MSNKNPDLHGNAPDKSDVALLLIDVINDLEFPEKDQIAPFIEPMATSILELKRRAKQAGVPVVYVNDNFGRWQSNFSAQVEHCLHDDVAGKRLVEILKPDDDDYFVLKPKHSGFYSTSLDILLDYLQTKTIILTGLAADICVLFTANDAYLRDFHVVAPEDCTAANTAEARDFALKQMRKILKADTRPARELDFAALGHDPAAESHGRGERNAGT
jgi:nicotinamidase-related amidase